MENKPTVKFRRIRGRIIPIRSNDQYKEQKQGAKISAASLAVAAGGGYFAGRQLRKADKISQMTFDFMEDLPKSGLPKGAKDIHHGFQMARKKLNFAKKFAAGTRLAATGLAFVGINKLLKNEKDSSVKEGAKVFGAAISAELVTRGLFAGSKEAVLKPHFKATSGAMKDLLKKLVKAKLK